MYLIDQAPSVVLRGKIVASVAKAASAAMYEGLIKPQSEDTAIYREVCASIARLKGKRSESERTRLATYATWLIFGAGAPPSTDPLLVTYVTQLVNVERSHYRRAHPIKARLQKRLA